MTRKNEFRTLNFMLNRIVKRSSLMENEPFEKIYWYFDNMLFDYIKVFHYIEYDAKALEWRHLNDRLFFNVIPITDNGNIIHNIESIYREINK